MKHQSEKEPSGHVVTFDVGRMVNDEIVEKEGITVTKHGNMIKIRSSEDNLRACTRSMDVNGRQIEERAIEMPGTDR